MKGIVVVICAPSQGGKDFIATSTMQGLENLYRLKTSYATSYKIREPRADDAKHICCVKDENSIPVEKDNQITATIYGTQKLIYNKNEIAQKIENGEVVFIATASTELATKIKKEFGSHSITAFVKRQQVSKEIMLIEDLNRHGCKIPTSFCTKKNLLEYIISNNYATTEEVESAKKRVNERVSWYEKMKPEYESFVADKTTGADYIFKNWHTLVGGSWNSTINEKANNEFLSFQDFISLVIKENNTTQNNWRENSFFDRFDEEIRTKNIFSMQDEWIKYIQNKHEREF